VGVLFWSTLVLLLLSVWVGVQTIVGGLRIQRLDQVGRATTETPLVSIIIAARDEEEKIKAALTSVLALTYDPLEIIVLDDRSSDATATILDHLEVSEKRLKVIYIKELEKGWLGKTRALHLGAKRAKGEYLLFTDADVHMAPNTIDLAVGAMEQRGLDHLCLIFRPVVTSGLLGMLVVDSLGGLISVLKPWRAKDQKAPYFFGVGAFNMVRTTTYRRMGGHEPIRLCPVDDILLGRLVKETGGCLECMNGKHCISVPWYGSVGEMIRGVEKNIFAAVDYRLSRLLLATVLIIGCNCLPLWGVVFTRGMEQLLCGLLVGAVVIFHLAITVGLGVPLRCLFWFPLTPYIKLYMMWYAVTKSLRKGGIEWRDTFYKLDQLKENMVPLWPWQPW
jgi:cellulose synthase/poly-beta-1,6-N-acetylglucosamine synthase-like glycosyltransferase